MMKKSLLLARYVIFFALLGLPLLSPARIPPDKGYGKKA